MTLVPYSSRPTLPVPNVLPLASTSSRVDIVYAQTRTTITEGNYTRYDVTVSNCKITGSDESANIQTLLAAGGYETIHSGKWHLTQKDTASFDDYAATVQVVEDSGFTSVASVYFSNMDTNDFSYNFSHNLEWMTNTSLDAIETAVAADKPFFLHFTPTNPHPPSNEEALLNFSVLETPAGTLSVEPATTMPSRQSVVDRAVTDEDGFRDSSMGTVWIDDALGALIDGIDALGVLNNTIIIFTQDHGQLSKNSLYEGGLRVCLFLMGPGVEHVNITTRVTNVDLLPTMLEAAGLSASLEGYVTDGVSWWGSVTSDGASTALTDREYIITEIDADRAVVGLQKSDYASVKLMSNYEASDDTNTDYPFHSDAEQLYNFSSAADPTEQTSLVDDAAYADALAALQVVMELHDEDTSVLTVQVPTTAPTVGTCDFTPVSRMGNGICNGNANTEACNYDEGDCCEFTCLQNSDADAVLQCGSKPYSCIDPAGTAVPTATPTVSFAPTQVPSRSPTSAPTSSPVAASPTASPTAAPLTSAPTASPSTVLTVAPSAAPTVAPSAGPSVSPSAAPSVAPNAAPYVSPSAAPSVAPSAAPSVAPSAARSVSPSAAPSAAPSVAPSAAPSVTPSADPTVAPSAAPSVTPSAAPTVAPSASPSVSPSAAPSVAPSAAPSVAPSAAPSVSPSAAPSVTPNAAPSVCNVCGSQCCTIGGADSGTVCGSQCGTICGAECCNVCGSQCCTVCHHQLQRL